MPAIGMPTVIATLIHGTISRATTAFIAALPAGATVLDLGCGSGSPVAKHMAEHGLHVSGVDSSPTLISLCRERLPDQEWLVGDMRLLQLRRRFDGILAWDSFFYLTPDDQRSMFDVFARHAASSAVLMFNSGPAHMAKASGRIGAALFIMPA
jgi:cyclopropane fatty-acyl-phospholipid synthase-like methyltransferase